MSLIAKSEAGERSILDAAVYRAVCVTIVDLGTHLSEKYNKESRHIRIIWELPDETYTYEDEETGKEVTRPGRISKRYYSMSLGKKANLAKDLEGWRSRPFTKEEKDGFDLKNILGKSCMLNIIHDNFEGGDTYAKIAGITPLMKGMTAAKPSEEPRIIMIDDPDPEWLNEWMVKDRENSIERMASTYGHDDPRKDRKEETHIVQEDDLPF